jgi:pimeloyl-ACP methyl ester carboxylesterase
MSRCQFLRLSFVATLVVGLCSLAHAADAPRGYQQKATVSAPTRLDWVFALANQSPASAPPQWLAGYDSAGQEYELFAPPSAGAKKTHPVILFISPSNQPSGWNQLQAVCKQMGIIFASPYGAGNDCPSPKRVRIVLDVLDDLRRKYPTDPDRTYLAGFSGGGRIACSVAFALPEYFGGILPICASGELREESWLRERVINRLSVALITGETDFNRSEVERLNGPLLTEVGVRTKVWTVPKLGHGIPDAKTLAEAVDWLEKAAPDRKKLAARYAAMRVDGDAAPSREQWSQALLKEAQNRLKQKATLFTGLMQLQGIRVRWADLPAAASAKQILTEYESRTERPWEDDDLAEQRKFLIAQARAIGAYASGPLPQQYAAERTEMAKLAVNLWQQVLADNPQSPAGKEAANRIPELQKIADGEMPK